MILAELEVCHSRPIAPTRRVALGYLNLPVTPAPGMGGVLLAGIVANSINYVDAEDRESLYSLFYDLVEGCDAKQIAVRHRFQDDLVGLTGSTQILTRVNGRFEFQFEDGLASPVQLVLGALYAAASLAEESRASVFAAIRIAWLWEKPVDLEFIDHILNWNSIGRFNSSDFVAWNDPIGWALGILSIQSENFPSKRAIQKRFRSLLREAHPDQGGVEADAGDRIQQLSDARDILLAKV